MGNMQIDTAIQILTETGDYKLLKRLQLDLPTLIQTPPPLTTKTGICLDTETTGLSSETCKIIELGMIAFEYDIQTCQVLRIIGRYNGFEDPGEPLSQEVKDVTGITDEMLVGQALDDEQVNNFLSSADIIIAHNSGFDRPFMENRYPITIQKCWACSMSQIDWKAEYISSKTLEYLLIKCGGWFIDAHRALNDAEGLLGLLLENLPHSGRPILHALIEKARQLETRIFAAGAPFDSKDKLKGRGYRWNDGEDGRPRSWWKDVANTVLEEETIWLSEEVYYGGDAGSVVTMGITPYNRFSKR